MLYYYVILLFAFYKQDMYATVWAFKVCYQFHESHVDHLNPSCNWTLQIDLCGLTQVFFSSLVAPVDTRSCWIRPGDGFAGVTAGLTYSHCHWCLVDKGYMLLLSFLASQWRSSSSQNSPTQDSLVSFPSARIHALSFNKLLNLNW